MMADAFELIAAAIMIFGSTTLLLTVPFEISWIPKGLMEDLIDNGEPAAQTLVNDQVNGFTTQQIFAALQSDVTTLAQYKGKAYISKSK